METMTRNETKCPACSSEKRKATKVIGIWECQNCGAIFGTCYLGQSYEFVLPFFVKEEPPAEETRYYDLTCLASGNKIQRRHGWYHPATKGIVQVG